jgi:hypothetical protein
VATIKSIGCSTLVLAPTLVAGAPALAQLAAPAAYGTTKFESYADIDKINCIKAAWDFNFADPKAVGVVFNNLAAVAPATLDMRR